jgi:hypothetical protein
MVSSFDYDFRCSTGKGGAAPDGAAPTLCPAISIRYEKTR